eukprot:gb/GFBE01031557.1/.p1 GENE.gb/GFBE01031557.1/~~gb/GFBE01031557.1/.p1  ORF type:complete len:284 (+),score=63.22 gb/GFBE01031557.1/:1-852(+)
MARPCPPSASRERKLRFGHLGLLIAACCAVVLSVQLTIPGPAHGTADAGQATRVSTQGMAASLEKAMAEIQSMETQVNDGKLVPKFGEQAAAIIAEARSVAPELGKAVEGALEALFLRQIAVLRQQVASAAVPEDLDAVASSEAQFMQQAVELSGPVWSLEPERRRLRASLERQVQTSAALAEERARAALAQRATVEVIGKLQEQMEQLAVKAQSARGGNSPWVLSTSYRIPNTPLQFVSRYEQGRANVELNLTPDKDPSKAEGGFASSFGPANIGVSFDLGI